MRRTTVLGGSGSWMVVGMSKVDFHNVWPILKQNMMQPMSPQQPPPQDYMQQVDAQRGMPWGNPPPNDPYNPMRPGGGPQDKRCSKCRYAPLKTPEEMFSGVCNDCRRKGGERIDPPWREKTPWKFPDNPDDNPWKPKDPSKPPNTPSPYDNPPLPNDRQHPLAGWTKCRRCNGTGKIQGNMRPYYNTMNKSEGFLERFIKGERIYKLYIPGRQPWDEKPNPNPYGPPDPQPPWDNPKRIPYEPIDCPDCNGKGIIPPTSGPQGSAASSA